MRVICTRILPNAYIRIENHVFTATRQQTRKTTHFMAAEKKLEIKLRDGVKVLGGLALKLVGSGFTGLPDRLVLMPGGRLYFVEMKAPGKKPSPRQRYVIGWLRKMGFSVWVIDNQYTIDIFLLQL